jgi:hypothetical protein
MRTGTGVNSGSDTEIEKFSQIKGFHGMKTDFVKAISNLGMNLDI